MGLGEKTGSRREKGSSLWVGLKRGMGNEEMGNGNEEMECGNRSKHHAMAPPSLRKALNFKRT